LERDPEPDKAKNMSMFTLRMLDPETGKSLQEVKQWLTKEENFAPFSGPYLVVNDRSIFLTTDRAVYAFDPNTGEQQFRINAARGSRIRVEGATLYTSQSDRLMAFDAATGQQKWVHMWNRRIGYLTGFSVNLDSIYVYCNCDGDAGGRSDEGWLIALDTRDGNERWAKPITDMSSIPLFTVPVLAGDAVMTAAGSEDRFGVTALDPADGKQRWSFVTHGLISTWLAQEGGRVIVLDRSPRWRNWLASLNPAWHGE